MAGQAGTSESGHLHALITAHVSHVVLISHWAVTLSQKPCKNWGVVNCAGVKRPPIAYYNAATGGVVVTPPKSLFTSFSKSLDKVMQVRALPCFKYLVSLLHETPRSRELCTRGEFSALSRCRHGHQTTVNSLLQSTQRSPQSVVLIIFWAVGQSSISWVQRSMKAVLSM